MIKVITLVVCVTIFAVWLSLPPPPNGANLEAYLITNLIQAECANCGEEDIDYITYTVMNRKTSKHFPNTVQEVLLQPKQFAGLKRKVYAGEMINSYVYRRVLHNLKKENIPEVLFFISSSCRSLNCEKIKTNRKVVFSTSNHIYLK